LDMTNKALPKRVAELRKEKCLTQIELARELHLGSGYIADIETGRCAVSVDTLERIADYFNVTTDYLLGRCE